MCYNTCVRKYGKIRHSVDCPLFTHFGNGDPIPFDWHRLDFAEKFRLKQKFARKKKSKIKTWGNLRNVKVFSSSLDDVVEL